MLTEEKLRKEFLQVILHTFSCIRFKIMSDIIEDNAGSHIFPSTGFLNQDQRWNKQGCPQQAGHHIFLRIW
jgi:hypothetical protein